ncbi:MAG: N-acetylmuramoyl-L-alanine amidase, partial [Thermoleophilaceae bacterium]|nr:N-acetylmuramoyl-L-alanine amidase [Thermoleophilaceae bacterium]
MKRTLMLVAALVAAATLVVAAPAMSVTPYLPTPVDFAMNAPGGDGVRAARAGRGFVSAPVRAPKRFNLVGMKWKSVAEPDIALRVRAAGGAWGPWTSLDSHTDGAPDGGSAEPTPRGVSSPAWAGESDELQYRLSEPVPGLRLHFVNTTGSSTPAARVTTALRSNVSRAVATLTTPVDAFAQAGGQPSIVPRAAWGADQGCRPRTTPATGTVKVAFVHHTVTANAYSAAQAPAAVLAICRYHRNSNGWSDIGYNFVVDRFGTIYEGRAGGIDRAVVGAQAQGWNAESTGIANLGTFSTERQTPQAISAVARLIRWKLPLHGAPTSGTVRLTSAGGATTRLSRGTIGTFNRVSGHRDGNNTSCPGNALFSQLGDIRARVAGATPETTGTPGGDYLPQTATARATLKRQSARVVAGRVARVTGSVSPATAQVTVSVTRR